MSAIALAAAYFADRFNLLDYNITDPLVNFMIAVFLAAVVFAFVSPNAQRAWLKAVAWLIPFSLLVIFSVSQDRDGLLFGLTGREPVSLAVSALFLGASLIIFVAKSWRSRA